MNRTIAVILGVFLVLHITAAGIPAAVAVLLAFTAAIATLTYLIIRVMHRDWLMHWATT